MMKSHPLFLYAPKDIHYIYRDSLYPLLNSVVR